MNIILFGPNGSGKGTQGAVLREKFGIPHIESGVIFRENIAQGTELGKKAKEYIDRGELVPDELTIPMILERLQRRDCARGWLLDGFPRNLNQAQSLWEALKRRGIKIDYVIEIVLDRETAKKRIMGRRLCQRDNNHPNNIFIEAIKPIMKNGELVCRVCGGRLEKRPDDQDEAAIAKRHDIYYDEQKGTLAAIAYFRQKASAPEGNFKFISVDGHPGVKEVSEDLLQKL